MNITICGIAYGCPHGKRENDCPFYEIDHLSFIEKVHWIKELNEEKELAIIRHHKRCTKNEKIKPPNI